MEDLPTADLRARAGRPLPVVGRLEDGFARRVRYLRVSLTDRCNYRCTYCMPEDMAFRRRAELLSFEELARVLAVFAGLGVRRVRLTGGEPTVRADVVELVGMIAAIAGIEQLAMTSNGHLLPALAAPLAAAGLSSINISLDTLDAQRFAAVTRRGRLETVIAGVEASVAAGLRVKLNAVALRGVNDHEVAALCRFAWERGIVIRFIEHMPMSDGQLYDRHRQFSAADIRQTVEGAFGDRLVPSGPEQADGGPARYWHLEGRPEAQVGIISAMTEHFCDSCNRLRLSAVGDLHPCLGYDDATSLRELVRAGATDDELEVAIRRAVLGKREGHGFLSSGAGAPSKHMIAIGG